MTTSFYAYYNLIIMKLMTSFGLCHSLIPIYGSDCSYVFDSSDVFIRTTVRRNPLSVKPLASQFYSRVKT